MYSQLIYFLVALVLFTLQQPGAKPLFPPVATAVAAVAALLLYALICLYLLRRLRRSLGLTSQSVLTRRYQRTQTRLSILALGFVAIHTYVLNIKFYLQIIPGFDQSLTLSGVAGLGLFLAHLLVLWIGSYPLYKEIYRSHVTLPSYLKGHIAFIMAVLVPWLLISIFSDLLQFVELPAFLRGDIGQFTLLGVALCIFVLFAPRLVVRMWGCKPLPSGPVRAELESFCRQHGFPIGDFMLWSLFGDEVLTAGIIGILPRWRYILITRGLLSLLDSNELKAVVAHEMGHVRRLHIIIYLIFFVCYSVLAYSFHDIFFLFLLKNGLFLQWAMAPDTFHLTLFSIVYTVPVLLMLILYFRYVFGFFMRNSERQADLYGLRIIGNPYSLITSLQKIAFHSGRIEDVPSWHHFSIRQRIDFLMKSYQQPQLAQSHDRKLYGSILLFFALAGGLSFLGLQLQNAAAVKQWKAQVQAQILEKQIHGQPANPDLYAAYAGLLLEQGRYQTALSLLTEAHGMAPENSTVINNLAWLYATSPSPYFHPEKALQLAQKAADLESQPYILDTLAEAYFVNGRYREAVEAIEQALAKNPENRDYYLQQMRKFEGADKSRKDRMELNRGG